VNPRSSVLPGRPRRIATGRSAGHAGCGAARPFAECAAAANCLGYVERLRKGEIPLRHLQSHQPIALEEINRAFDLMHAGSEHRSADSTFNG